MSADIRLAADIGGTFTDLAVERVTEAGTERWTAKVLTTPVAPEKGLLEGVALVLEQNAAGTVGVMGLLAVLVATAAWGLDNALSRPLAERDPGQVVLGKAVLGGAAAAVLAVWRGEPARG